MTEKNSPRLPVHERYAVIAVIGLLVLLTAIIILYQDPILPETELPRRNQSYVIHIKGAVEYPGRYQIQEGATLRDALALAHPTPEANLQKIKLDEPVRKGQILTIPKLRKKNRSSP